MRKQGAKKYVRFVMIVKMRMKVKIASDTQFSDDSLSARPSKLLTCKEPTTKQLFLCAVP